MLCTKNLATDFKEIPREWIWSYYCNLWDATFDGSTYTIYSVFRSERTPSMKIFFRGGRYRFRDYGNGMEGDDVDLIKCLALVKENKKINYFQVSLRVLEDYNRWTLDSGKNCELRISDFKKERKYDVRCKTRKWNELDKEFWSSFCIGSKVLSHFNVAALSEFTLTSQDNEFTVSGEYVYGYFNYRGQLCKIYQPKVAKRKYIYVKDYLQGEDQLKGHDFLIIQSGLKDIISFYTMGLRVDSIAPHSENTMLHSAQIKKLLKSYKQVLIMLDSDEAGHKAMARYTAAYAEIKPVFLYTGEKDVADTLRKWRVEKSKRYFVPLIERVLNRDVSGYAAHPTLFE